LRMLARPTRSRPSLMGCSMHKGATWDEFVRVARAFNELIEGGGPDKEVWDLLFRKGLVDEDYFWIGDDD
jgi:hypothetical protein